MRRPHPHPTTSNIYLHSSGRAPWELASARIRTYSRIQPSLSENPYCSQTQNVDPPPQESPPAHLIILAKLSVMDSSPPIKSLCKLQHMNVVFEMQLRRKATEGGNTRQGQQGRNIWGTGDRWDNMTNYLCKKSCN